MKKMLMLAGLLFTACAALAGPRLRYTINEHWKFFKGECPGAEEPGYDVSRWETVDLPHTWNEADVEDEPYGWYRGAGWYVRDLPIARRGSPDIPFVRGGQHGRLRVGERP